MDINSLLSPQGAAPSKPAPMASPPKARRTNTGSSQVIVSSPLTQSTLPPPNLPPHVFAAQDQAPRVSPGKSPTIGSKNDTPPVDAPAPPSRISSTPSMDALADLASMQNHQPTRSTAPMLRRNTESFESQGSPSTMYPHVQTNHLTPRPSIDLAMSETPKPLMRTDFSKTSLSPERQERATVLMSHLQENPYAYVAHAELVKLLHDGFMDHVYPPDSPTVIGDPQTYDLLADLHAARENMDKLFAIGEDLWAEWIQDEGMLAKTLEERVTVMEKCQKAIEEEYGSTKLWLKYGEWVYDLYSLVQGHTPAPSNIPDLSEEDRIVGKEIFTWPLVLETWTRAAEETMWRISDSHLVWNGYIKLLIQDLARAPSQEGIHRLNSLFETRLQTPHADWDSTFQLYSTFISTYMNDQYEAIMVSTTRNATDAKATVAQREDYEFKLSRAQESGDRTTEYNIWFEYLEWDATPGRKKQTAFELTNALYERAELRFPADTNLWEDHLVLLLDAKRSVLSLLARATRHCPWSGSLWSQSILASEREGLPFHETEEIKHKATTTGLLDVGGMDEVLKVHTAWCNYLRRRAFQAGSLDEDLDVAEMGIRSSIETVQELRLKKYGKDHQGDPYFRLERVYIKFLSESGSWDSARETFRGLIESRSCSWEFWMRWYIWEMMCWAKFIQGENSADDSRNTPAPHYATAVLKQGMEWPNVDWPERLIEAYIVHCEDHEDAETLQLAITQARTVEKKVARRRQGEAEAASAEAARAEAARAEAAAIQTEHPNEPTTAPNGTHIGKRKREDEVPSDDERSKKSKAEDPDILIVDAPNVKEKQLKRDRENSTILVENLPGDITEVRVRQFFRDCGVVNSLKIIRNSSHEASVVIEFDEHEAALAAQTRDQKDLDGHTISIQMGSGSTIFVSNFPPTADEATIRDMFSKYGEIIDIRFPSLKYNTHRRFCYVQFKLNSEAQAATEMDGHAVDDNLKLVAKISNPLNKQDRSGPLEEGREVYVRNIDWSLSEDDLGLLFKDYGTVESVRIPRGVNGKSKGFGYVVFSSKDEATAALEMNGKSIKNRDIHVEISSKTGAKRQATNIINRVDRTKSPSADRGSEGAASSQQDEAHNANSDRHARTLGLMNIPDTVNDSRIRALAESYGPLVKVVLRPDHQGAIVEYLHASDAGKASLALEGSEIAPGRKIHVGTVPEMLKQHAERRVDKIQVGKQKRETEQSTSMSLMNPGPIRRPGQPGRRGGLGVKRGGFGGSGLPVRSEAPTNGTTASPSDTNGTASGVGKSNDDFRALLEKK